MVSLKKLVKMAKKWRRMAILGRRRITVLKKASFHDNLMAEKGHFVVYSMDGKRFMVPLKYLSSRIIEQLFKMSEEEFGFTVDGPITWPCNSVLMEYIVDLIKKGVSEEMESDLLSSLLLPCPCVSCPVQDMGFNKQIQVF